MFHLILQSQTVPRIHLLFMSLVTLAFSSSAALAQALPAASHGSHVAPSSPSAVGDHASMPMHQAMKDMQKNAEALKMTGNVDMDFAMMMVVHHQGAIDMAQSELKNGQDPRMLKAAKRILEEQQTEIAMFEAWMKAHPRKKIK